MPAKKPTHTAVVKAALKDFTTSLGNAEKHATTAVHAAMAQYVEKDDTSLLVTVHNAFGHRSWRKRPAFVGWVRKVAELTVVKNLEVKDGDPNQYAFHKIKGSTIKSVDIDLKAACKLDWLNMDENGNDTSKPEDAAALFKKAQRAMKRAQSLMEEAEQAAQAEAAEDETKEAAQGLLKDLNDMAKDMPEKWRPAYLAKKPAVGGSPRKGNGKAATTTPPPAGH